MDTAVVTFVYLVASSLLPLFAKETAMPSAIPDRLRPASLIVNKTVTLSTAQDGLRLRPLTKNAMAAPSVALECLQLVHTVTISRALELQYSVFWPRLQLPELNKDVLHVSVIASAAVRS